MQGKTKLQKTPLGCTVNVIVAVNHRTSVRVHRAALEHALCALPAPRARGLRVEGPPATESSLAVPT
jgi:hypothetical protein